MAEKKNGRRVMVSVGGKNLDFNADKMLANPAMVEKRLGDATFTMYGKDGKPRTVSGKEFSGAVKLGWGFEPKTQPQATPQAAAPVAPAKPAQQPQAAPQKKATPSGPNYMQRMVGRMNSAIDTLQSQQATQRTPSQQTSSRQGSVLQRSRDAMIAKIEETAQRAPQAPQAPQAKAETPAETPSRPSFNQPPSFNPSIYVGKEQGETSWQDTYKMPGAKKEEDKSGTGYYISQQAVDDADKKRTQERNDAINHVRRASIGQQEERIRKNKQILAAPKGHTQAELMTAAKDVMEESLTQYQGRTGESPYTDEERAIANELQMRSPEARENIADYLKPAIDKRLQSAQGEIDKSIRASIGKIESETTQRAIESAKWGGSEDMALAEGESRLNIENITKALTSDLDATIQKLFKAEDIKKDIESSGMDEEEYYMHFANAVADQIYSTAFDELVKRKLPKNAIDYLLSSARNNIINNVINAIARTQEQKEIAGQAEYLTQTGRNPYYNPSTGMQLAGTAVSFATDIPAMGAIGKGINAMMPVTRAAMMQETIRLANKGWVGRLGVGTGRAALSTYLNFTGYNVLSTVASNAATGQKTTIGHIVEAAENPGALIGVTGKMFGNLFARVGVNGMERTTAQWLKNASKKMLVRTGAFATETSSFAVGEWLLGDHSQPLTIANFIESGEQLVAMKIGGMLGHAAMPSTNSQPKRSLVGRAVAAIDRGTRASVAAKQRLSPDVRAEIDRTKSGKDFFEHLDVLVSTLMETQETKAQLKAAAKSGDVDRQRELSARQVALEHAYRELTNELSWDAENALNIAVFGVATGVRPRAAKIIEDNDGIYELDSNGRVLSVRYTADSEERTAFRHLKDIQREQFDLRSLAQEAHNKGIERIMSLEPTSEEFAKYADAFIDIDPLAMTMSRAEVVRDMQDAKTEIGKRFLGFLADKTGVLDVLRSFNVSGSEFERLLTSDPNDLDAADRGILTLLTVNMDALAHPRGEVNPEASGESGRRDAEQAGAGTPTPDVERMKALSDAVDAAKNAYDQWLTSGTDEASIFSEALRTTNDMGTAYMEALRQGVTEEKLAPVADYINATSRQQGFMEATQDKIDENVSRFVSMVTHRQSGNVHVVVDAQGKEWYIVNGAFEQVGAVTDKGQRINITDEAGVVLAVDEEGNVRPLSGKDLYLTLNMNTKEAGDMKRKELEEINARAIEAAGGGNGAQTGETPPTDKKPADNTPKEGDNTPADNPPVDNPPADNPPADNPPTPPAPPTPPEGTVKNALGEDVDPRRRGHDEIVNNINKFRDSQSETDKVVAYASLLDALYDNPDATAKERAFIEDAKKELEGLGYEFKEPTPGEPFDIKNPVREVTSTTRDTSLKEGEKVIDKVESPIISKDGKVVRTAAVTTRGNITPDSEDVRNFEERLIENDARVKQGKKPLKIPRDLIDRYFSIIDRRGRDTFAGTAPEELVKRAREEKELADEIAKDPLSTKENDESAEFDKGIEEQANSLGDVKPGTAKAKTPKDYVSDDSMRPVMSGVHHDSAGYGVVSDGLIVYYDEGMYDPEHDGDTVATGKIKGNKAPKEGEAIEALFPRWRTVLPGGKGRTYSIDPKRLASIAVGLTAKAKDKLKTMGEKLKDPMVALRLPDGRVVTVSSKYLALFADAMKKIGATDFNLIKGASWLLHATTEKGGVIIQCRFGEVENAYAFYDLKDDSRRVLSREPVRPRPEVELPALEPRKGETIEDEGSHKWKVVERDGKLVLRPYERDRYDRDTNRLDPYGDMTWEDWQKKHTERKQSEFERRRLQKAQDAGGESKEKFIDKAVEETKKGISSKIPKETDITWVAAAAHAVAEKTNDFLGLSDWIAEKLGVPIAEARAMMADKTAELLKTIGVDKIKDITDLQALRNAMLYAAHRSKYDQIRAAFKPYEDALKSKTKKEVLSRIKEGKVTLDEVEQLYYAFAEGTRMGELRPLAEKVFKLLRNLNLDIKFTNDLRTTKGRREKDSVIGIALESRVRYRLTHLLGDRLHATDESNASLLLHELIHVCTSYATWTFKNPFMSKQRDALKKRNPERYKEIEDAVNTLQEIYSYCKRDKSGLFKIGVGDKYYGLTDVDELIAEMANPNFRDALKKKNLWKKFKDSVLKLLGINTEKDADAEHAASVALDKLLDNFDEELWNELDQKAKIDSPLFREEMMHITERMADVERETPTETAARIAEEERESKRTWSEEEEKRRKPIRKRVKQIEKVLGVRVRLVETPEDIRDKMAADAVKRGVKVRGWYNDATGDICLYLPNVENARRAAKVYFHEVVGHLGLERLFNKKGEGEYDKFLDHVWDSMSQKERDVYWNYEGVKGMEDNAERRRKAADEYMAKMAEDQLGMRFWEKALNYIAEKLGFKDITALDLKEAVKASYENLKGEAASPEIREAADNITKKGGQVDTEKGDVMFAVADILDDKEYKKAVKELMKVTGRSERTVRKYLDAERSLAKVILDEDNVALLDMQVDDSVPSIWNNSDYPQGTVEFSNICRKRLPFTMIYQRLQKEFPNMVIDAKTLESIRGIMKEAGSDVACGLCFVEDRRQLLGEIGQSFIDMLSGKNDQANDNQKKAHEKLIQSGDKYIPNLYELLTLDGMKALRKNHPAVAQAFIEYNSARGMQAGRLFQAYSAYHREILGYSKAKVKNINDNGGLRIFSFSDFEAHHLIDLVQVLTDCAIKGVKVQGYTKVPEFAKAVKDTGMKLNRSLIAKAKGVVDADYVPQKGEAVSPNVINGKRLLFDTIEGIDVNHPDFFDSSGNRNVGNIVVGISDEHIMMAMLDPFVDYIIPFHSGLSEAIRKQKGIGDWVNYKLVQLEKKYNAEGKLVNADKHGINIYTDVLPRGVELIGHEIENVRDFQLAFFKACAEKGWVPRFSKFIKTNEKGEYVYTPGYDKLLIDFKLFDKKGRLIPQEVVKPIFDNDYNKKILDDYVRDMKENGNGVTDELYDKVKKGLGLGKPDEKNLHFSAEDKSYMEAVERGDEKSIIRMVKDAARRAMPETKVVDKNKEPVVLYRGGVQYNVYEPSKASKTAMYGPAFYATTSEGEAKEMAKTRTGSEENVQKVYLNTTNPFVEEWVEEFGDLKVVGDKEVRELCEALRDKGFVEAMQLFSKWRNGTFQGSIVGWLSDSKVEGRERPSGTWWNNSSIVQETLRELGYDGVIGKYSGENFRATQVAVFDPEQIKSAEPVTRDDAGNVIPLSERFNPKKKDIRFSAERREDESGDLHMSYGAPYQGSKNRIAKRIIDLLPKGKRFVDLFSGGGAMTHAAIESGKYERQHMNDIDDAGQRLFLDGARGKWRDRTLEPISEEEFAALKNEEGRPEAILRSAMGKGQQMEKTQDGRSRTNEQLRRVQSLEGLDVSKVSATKGDYRDVKLEKGDVVYCDIPYEKTNQEGYQGTFDKQAFIEWAQKQDGMVFVSEFSMPEGWTEIASFDVVNKGKRQQEKLWVQDKFAADYFEAREKAEEPLAREMERGTIHFSVETDPETLDRLNKSKKVEGGKLYRAMVLIDGKLYPPMASKEGKGKRSALKAPSELGVWERSDEAPDKAFWKKTEDGDGWYITITKDDGKSLEVAYNPYFHASTTMLNDQFMAAQTRPNLVIVECDVPESELEQGYKADKAKDPVGMLDWKAGPIQGKLTGTRNVMLSRWMRPMRIVGDEEVAKHVMECINGEIDEMPSNVVTPSLRKELEKLGMKFVETDNKGNLLEGPHKGITWSLSWKVRHGEELTSDQKKKLREIGIPFETKKKPKKNSTRFSADLKLKDVKEFVEEFEVPENISSRAQAAMWAYDMLGRVRGMLNELYGDKASKDFTKGILSTDSEQGRKIDIDNALYGRARVNQYLDFVQPKLYQARDNSTSEEARKYFQNVIDECNYARQWYERAANGDTSVIDDNKPRFSVELKEERDPDPLATITRIAKEIKAEVRRKRTHPDPVQRSNPYQDIINAPDSSPAERRTLFSVTPGAYDTLPGAVQKQRYDDALKKKRFSWKEAWVDRLQSVKELCKALTGIKDIDQLKDHHNVYRKLVHMASVVQATQEKAYNDYGKPLIQAIERCITKVGGDRGKAYDKIHDYLWVKSGLERNRVLRVRDNIEAERAKVFESPDDLGAEAKAIFDALKTGVADWDSLTDEQKADTERALMHQAQNEWCDKLEQKWYTRRKSALDELENGRIDLREYFSRLDEWISSNWDYEAGDKKNDYAAINLAVDGFDDEGKYDDDGCIQIAMDVEAELGGLEKDLWKCVRDMTHRSLELSYESGITSKAAYEHVRDMMDWYVPMRKWAEAMAEDINAYYISRRSPQASDNIVMRAKGRKDKNDDVIATMMQMMDGAISQGEANKAKQALYRLVNSLNTPDEALITNGRCWVEKVGTDTEGNDIWEIRTADTDESMTPEQVAKAVADFEEEMRVKQEAGLARVMNNQLNVPYKFEKPMHKSEHAVVVFVGGNRHVMYINGNPRAAQALNGMVHENSSGLGAGIRHVNRYLAATFTSLSPKFVLRNVVRDADFSRVNVFTKEGWEYTFNPQRGYIRNWYQAFFTMPKMWKRYNEGTLGSSGDDALLAEFMANGGKTGYVSQKQIDEYKTKLRDELERAKQGKTMWERTKGNFRCMLHVLEAFNNWAENVARFAVYKTSRQHGRSVLRSIADAKDASTNFNIKGAYGGTYNGAKTLNAKLAGATSNLANTAFVFVNPAIQSLALTARNFKSNPARATIAYGLHFAVGMVWPTLMAWWCGLIGGDDDDAKYSDVPEYIRRNNICFYMGGDDWVPLPLSIETSGAWELGEIFASNFLGHDELKSDKSPIIEYGSLLTHLMPVDPLASEGRDFWVALSPTQVAPLMQNARNRKWTGLPIEKDKNLFNKDDPKWMRATQSTSPALVDFCKNLSDWSSVVKDSEVEAGSMDWSPGKIENILRGYTGGTGGFILDILAMAKNTINGEFDMQRMPLLNGLYYKSEIGNKSSVANSRWWAIKNAVDVKKRGLKVIKKKMDTADPTSVARYKAYERKWADMVARFKETEKLVKQMENFEPASEEEAALIKVQIDSIKNDAYKIYREAIDE